MHFCLSSSFNVPLVALVCRSWAHFRILCSCTWLSTSVSYFSHVILFLTDSLQGGALLGCEYMPPSKVSVSMSTAIAISSEVAGLLMPSKATQWRGTHHTVTLFMNHPFVVIVDNGWSLCLCKNASCNPVCSSSASMLNFLSLPSCLLLYLTISLASIHSMMLSPWSCSACIVMPKSWMYSSLGDGVKVDGRLCFNHSSNCWLCTIIEPALFPCWHV